jgi:pectate lyase
MVGRPFLGAATCVILAAQAFAGGGLPAFPGAEGFGAYARGGRGGAVLFVDNLGDSGPGSLRAAVEATGPRIIIFRVSGTIALATRLRISDPYVTIAGQTAPGDGICLKDHHLVVSADHVIVRYLRVRPGDNAGAEVDSISVTSGENVIIDHCSTSWSVDETLSVAGDGDNVTVQWCMITEPLNNSVHSKGEHGYAALIRGSNGARYTYHHNLFAHFKARGPRPGNYVDHLTDPVGLLFDFRNNVCYNWGGSSSGYNSDTESISRYNFVGNYYKTGPNSSGSYAFKESCPYAAAHFSGNYMNGSEPADPWSLVTGSTGGAYRQSVPFDAGTVTTDSAPDAYARVLREAGASIRRDPVDARIVRDVMDGTGRIIDDEADVGSWPALDSAASPRDSDADGMPDDWETGHGLDPADPSDGNDTAPGGYTWIEEYINSLVPGPTTRDDVDAVTRDLRGGAAGVDDASVKGTIGAYRAQ